MFSSHLQYLSDSCAVCGIVFFMSVKTLAACGTSRCTPIRLLMILDLDIELEQGKECWQAKGRWIHSKNIEFLVKILNF